MPPSDKGKSRDATAEYLGVSGRTLEKAKAVGAEERKAAKARQGERTDQHPGKFSRSSQGRARDAAAEYLGVSGRTLEKAKAVASAAEAEPDKYGGFVEKMDRTGKNRHKAPWRDSGVSNPVPGEKTRQDAPQQAMWTAGGWGDRPVR